MEVSAPQRPAVKPAEPPRPVEKTKAVERPPERSEQAKPADVPPPKPQPYVNTRGETTGQRINTQA